MNAPSTAKSCRDGACPVSQRARQGDGAGPVSTRRAVRQWFTAPLLALLTGAAGAASDPVLRANHPAARWDHTYPVGNGSLGAMSFGSYPEARIVLNHDTLWSKPARVELAPDSRTNDVAQAFALALAGDYAGAEAAYGRAKNKGNHVATFQTLGQLSLTHLDAPSNAAPRVERSLDLMSGESRVIMALPDGEIRETLLASYPDRCLALRLESTRPGGLHVRLALSRPAGVTSRSAQGNVLGLIGDCGTKFTALASVFAETGGTVTAEGETLVLQGGAAAMIVVTAATDYNRADPRQPRTDAWAADGTSALKKAAATGWAALRERAVADHRALMQRCRIDLGPSEPELTALTTPERMDRLRKGGRDPELLVAFFQLGRHMLLGSSRPGSLPPNLQGLWEPGLKAAWNGDFHLNVNVQMNMWPAALTGLEECNEPFFALLKLLHRHGQETAASLGCRGYAAGLASDAWGLADWIGGSPEWDSWILGGHWAQEHLMEHYRFTQDRAFLRETAWPILKDGALFLIDWLREESGTGRLISGPGGSPENKFTYTDAEGKSRGAYISVGNTVDHAIAWETFSDVLECARLLGIRDDFTAQVEAALKRVPPPAIGEDGRILEWWKPFGEVWKGHRHKSHLYGLYPGRQITRDGTPDLAAAAEKSLVMRMDPKNGDCAGGGHTGWNLAWSAALWARLGQGDRALEMIHEQLRTQVSENLFNRCGGPFQIDGNLGTPAAIAEMLVQSREEGSGFSGQGSASTELRTPNPELYLVELLPALPADWPSGSARGLRARGGIAIDLDWAQGRVTTFRLFAPDIRTVRVRVNGEIKTVATEIPPATRAHP